uniref:Cobyrinic acid ac-diamide synthase n=1 Tax=Cyanothece sp. (strain PCC 7425 / ATCC 29141) TaxID=395961 RepID=B8HXQ2_CYAP4
MGKIISVHSFRGGTGKSNITANLAVSLARLNQRVGIVDTDIQSPGIHVIFGLDQGETIEQGYALNDYLWGNCAIEEAAHDVSHILNSTEAAGGGRLFLVPSSLKTSEITRVLREGYDVGFLNEGFQQLLEVLQLDYLLIDTHPGLNEETLLSITISDVLFLVLRPDKQDFQGTAVTVDVARQLDVPQMLLVVNKVPRSYELESLKEQVSNTYNATVAGVLPLSEEMLQLASSGIFCLHYPSHPFSLTIKSMVEQIRD